MEVTLQDILQAREQRVQRQKQLLDRFGMPLVCFTMNIAGPVKNSQLITQGFRLGQKWLNDRFVPEYEEENIAPTGCEYYFAVEGDAKAIKAQTCQIEDSIPMGRLFDMDVIAPDGNKLSRAQVGLPERKCLLCGGDARICGRSRAHSVEALQAETQRLLKEGLQHQRAADIASKAVYALVCEVYTTPKPGLVDRNNTGSHTDMDLRMFLASAEALGPYLTRCAAIGMETACLSPAETFARLRPEGLAAEPVMYLQTNGANTHKGAIFTMGLLCAAAGRLESRDPATLLSEVKAMTAGLCEKDFSGLTAENAVTAGQKLYLRHGITGVRGQAEAGFPAVLETGLPVLEQGLTQGRSINDAGCAALLHLLCATTDTNMVARSDLATAQAMTQRVADILAQTPYPDEDTLRQLDREFIEKNLSPGGAADLLAATYFLYFLNQ